MAINWSDVVYAPQHLTFGRPITVTPRQSQPTKDPYQARGIYNTVRMDVMGLDGTVFSEQKTILDILVANFLVPPIQHDLIDIPAEAGMPALGQWEILDTDDNGGGEITLTIRQIVKPKP
jgi:hypothetical protein